MNGFTQYCPLDHPKYLNGLSIIEERLLAVSSTYGCIMKLKKTAVAYRHMKGHIIVVPQKPTMLGKILPVKLLQAIENVKVIWVGKFRPTPEDIRV
jgi:hypothetical protein